jgi:hypothetical protein
MPLDLTRSLLVVLIPGGVAIAPWLLCLVNGSPTALTYIEKFQNFAVGLSFAIVVIVGLTCETIGTWIEVRWDAEREREFDVTENWYRYLANPVKPEPVGYRYLSRRATAFYFELAMFIACLPFVAGMAVFARQTWPDLMLTNVIVVVLGSISAIWFRWNARTTHEVLCRTRREINQRCTSSKPGAK